jgi:hypothetical protein
VHLTGDEVGPQDVARRRPPRAVGPERAGLARRQCHDQLQQERGRRAVVVDAAGDAVLPAPPAVAEECPDDVLPRRQQRRDVVGLHLEALAVGGPSGGQLQVADPRAVDERLVDAVGGDVQPRPGDLAVDAGGARQLVGGPLPGREVAGLDRRHPPGDPVRRVDQTVLPRGRGGPLALAPVGPHLHPPLDPQAGGRRHAHRDEGRLGGLHPPRVPAPGDDPVGVLGRGPGRQLPRQPGRGVDAERVAEVIGAQVVRAAAGHGAPSGRCGRSSSERSRSPMEPAPRRLNVRTRSARNQSRTRSTPRSPAAPSP